MVDKLNHDRSIIMLAVLPRPPPSPNPAAIDRRARLSSELELNLRLALHEHLLCLAATFLTPFHFVSAFRAACTVVFFRVFDLTALFVHMLWELRVRSCDSIRPASGSLLRDSDCGSQVRKIRLYVAESGEVGE